mmetsp:Transcript_1211/g.3523  ORF Transcript_1211/g.3523 Transcript_1211/m.3523 type:complete len:213 (-) Transcript_1211:219-857(-)
MGVQKPNQHRDHTLCVHQLPTRVGRRHRGPRRRIPSAPCCCALLILRPLLFRFVGQQNDQPGERPTHTPVAPVGHARVQQRSQHALLKHQPPGSGQLRQRQQDLHAELAQVVCLRCRCALHCTCTHGTWVVSDAHCHVTHQRGSRVAGEGSALQVLPPRAPPPRLLLPLQLLNTAARPRLATRASMYQRSHRGSIALAGASRGSSSEGRAAQ